MDSSPQNIMGTGALNVDQFSDLPNNIIENILMHLPIREAAKTSILSRKWRYHWRNIPALVFDESFSKRRSSVRIGPPRLLSDMNQVLSLHHGPIEKFNLSISLPSCPEIDNAMSLLCDKHVQEFTFDLVSQYNSHKIPSCLFSFQKLRHLELVRCVFEALPTLGGFPNLTSLKFRLVDFASLECNTFISKCPLLEHLTIDKCKRIVLLEIDAPNLKSLFIGGSVKSFVFKNTPLLSSVKIANLYEFGNVDEGLASKLIRFFECLPVVEYLQIFLLQRNFMAEEKLSKRLPITISHLRVLELHVDFERESDVSWLLGLIMSSPNLQKLKLAGGLLHPARNPLAVKLFEGDEDLSDATLENLQEVEIKNFFGMPMEFEFIKFMLAKTVVLETLLLEPRRDCEAYILRVVAGFESPSSNAEVIYSDSKVRLTAELG